MAMGNFFKGELLKGLIDCRSTGHAFKMILLATTQTFDIDADDGYTQLTAKELANGSGYTTGGATMAGGAVAVDDVNDRADATWNNVVWTAAGGSIGPSPRAVIFDDTHASDAAAGDIDFSGEQTATDGGTFTVQNPTVRVS